MTNRTRAPLSGGRSWRSALACACCLLLAPLAVDAQIIPVKTVPFAEGDQLGFFPSANLGMAGVSIAIADTLFDPFVNPAKASRLKRGSFFGSPSFYSLSRRAGSGRTLPLGAIARSGNSFAGVSIAIQEINPAQLETFGGFAGDPFRVGLPPDSGFTTAPIVRQPRSNRYASAMLGQTIPKHGLSLGASLFWSDLNAVDGLDQLYAGSQAVRPSGHAFDLRAGLLKEWGTRRSFEALVLHNRSDVTHDVAFADLFWDPGLRQPRQRTRLETFDDRTRTSGVHLEYEQALTDSAWRMGALLTANRATHPGLPGYDFMNVPRDPGHSSAFNLGFGLAKSQGPMRLGVDMIYEPIWSNTGIGSVENHFEFSNSILRAGISRDFHVAPSQGQEPSGSEPSLRLQLGLQLRSIHYWLERFDAGQFRSRQEEGWKEWTNTFGTSVRFPELEIHYRMRSASGAGRPGIPTEGPVFVGVTDASFAPVPFPFAPTTLTTVRVTTHQFSISVPIR